MAFPPGLLPVESWRKLMGSLDKHFGADASLSTAQAAEISAFLAKNASNRWSAKTAPLRITDSAWFLSKHRAGEVPADVWKRASVKSPSNCVACHGGADKGDFNEHNVRIPK
jgi:nitrate/TMAO reductase-like tetraheme cytochrome c subunit